MYVTKGTVKLAKALSAFFLGFYQIRTLFKGCMGQSLQCVLATEPSSVWLLLPCLCGSAPVAKGRSTA